MKAHRATVRRFIRFVLGIEPANLCLHQTLTFSPPLFDARTAKAKLKRLLDNLTKRFDMGSFYVMEEQGTGALHFHVLFVFFHGDSLPYAVSRMTIDFRAEVMRAWGNLQAGKLHPQANRTTIVPNISPDYLLKGVEIVNTGSRKPASMRWWARWNEKLFASTEYLWTRKRWKRRSRRVFQLPHARNVSDCLPSQSGITAPLIWKENGCQRCSSWSGCSDTPR